MADDKNARDKQARDAERRQQEREIATELERRDEPEPPVDSRELGELEAELEAVEFPATGADLVAEIGDREIGVGGRPVAVGELLPETDEPFDAPDAVRAQVERPTIAAATKRVLEAVETLPNAELSWSQRKAYEKTFRELGAIDADDEDEGIDSIADWIVERIRDKERVPKSRDVRRQAAKFCRSNGYQVRNDEWLGI